MKFKQLTLSLAIIPVFVFGGAYPPGSEKYLLNAMVSESEANETPEAPKVNEITTNTFTITGTANGSDEVTILKNGQLYKIVTADSDGLFSVGIPLQSAGVVFGFYSKNDKGVKSEISWMTVLEQERPGKMMISAPVVKQLPELARGCEVTSLAMLLQYAGIDVGKMILAEQIKKDPAKLKMKNGQKHFGNPNNGFVGDMYTYSKPGYGVYNGPIEELANHYLPGRIVNLSGGPFDQVLDYVASGHPVWVITTSWFDYVPKKHWETWQTEAGSIQITMKMHSVLITGYDDDYVYFNDPLDGKKNKRVLKEKFIKGWNQFGNQAISYY